jgi:hypothetical protein
LDSFSALNLIKLLKKLSSHCAILLTIHQPSSQIFFLFDIIIFMKEGRIFYQGPLKGMSDFYASKGYSCPENYNPSDFIMDLCQQHSGKELDQMGLFQPIPERFLHDEHKDSTTPPGEEKPSPHVTLAEKGKSKSMRFVQKDFAFHFESSFYKQTSLLTYREILNTYRDYHTIAFKFFLTLVLNLLYGLLYYQIGTKSYANADDFNSHFGGITMIMMFSLMGSGQSVLLSFPYERPMVLREYVTGTCKNPNFFPCSVANYFIVFYFIFFSFRWYSSLFRLQSRSGSANRFHTNALRLLYLLLVNGFAWKFHFLGFSFLGFRNGLLFNRHGIGLFGSQCERRHGISSVGLFTADFLCGFPDSHRADSCFPPVGSISLWN